MEPSIQRGPVRVSMIDLGEGYNGDYDPDDPDDAPLWRFDVYVKDGGSWEPLDDCSYCTRLPTTAPKAQVEAVLRTILEAVYEPVSRGDGAKHLCSRLSWLDGSGDDIGGGIKVYRPAKSIRGSKRAKQSKRTSRRA